MRLKKAKMRMEDIIDAARKEEWDLVDRRIPEVCNDSEAQEIAIKLLGDSNANLRDLGASILAKSTKLPTPTRTKPILQRVMEGDSNPYARYRAAFALAGHHPGRYRPKVIEVLKEAAQDKDVGQIAKDYLRRLDKK